MASITSARRPADPVAEAFNRDGFYIAKGLYRPQEMLDWKARVIRILEAGGHIEQGREGKRRPRIHGRRTGPLFQRTDAGFVRSIQGSQTDHWSERGIPEREVGLQGQIHHVRIALAPGLVLLERRDQDLRVDRAGRRNTPENGCLKMIRRQPYQAVQGETGQGRKRVRVAHRNEEIAGLPETTLAVNRGDAVFFHDQDPAQFLAEHHGRGPLELYLHLPGTRP